MSVESTSQSITSDIKEKDPCRVATGKRLGTMSKEAKEHKHLEREEQERMTRDSEKGGYAVYFVGGLVVVRGLSYLSYRNKDKLMKIAHIQNL